MKGHSHPTHSKRLGQGTPWGTQILALGHSCLSTTPWWFKIVTTIQPETSWSSWLSPKFICWSLQEAFLDVHVCLMVICVPAGQGRNYIHFLISCLPCLTPWLGQRRIYRTSFCTNIFSFIYANLAGGWWGDGQREQRREMHPGQIKLVQGTWIWGADRLWSSPFFHLKDAYLQGIRVTS